MEKMEKKFKVGDRVKFVNNEGHRGLWESAIGQFATVVKTDDEIVDSPYDYLIEFDIPGYGLFSNGDKKSVELYVHGDNLELVSDEKMEDEETTEEESKPKKFKVGDRVKFVNNDGHGDWWKESVGELATVINVVDDGCFDYYIEFDNPGFGLFSNGDKKKVELYAYEKNLELVSDESKTEAETKKFKVGDRVKIMHSEDYFVETHAANKTGTIIAEGKGQANYAYDYGIECDEFIDGHDCDDCGSPGYCIWVYEDDIELLPEEPRLDSELIEMSKPTRIAKFLFIEDGTVDVDNLEQVLEDTNPEIKIVVYRQGGQMPKLVEVD